MGTLNFLSRINGVFEITLFLVGSIIGLYFFVLGCKNKNHLTFLGVFLISYNFYYGTNIAEIFDVVIKKVDLLPLYFLYLSLPVFLLYAKKISVYDLKKRDYLLLIPAGIEFLYVGYQWFFNQPEVVRDTKMWMLYILGAFVFNTVLCLVALFYLVQHVRQKKKMYTHLGIVQLQWTRNVIISVLGSLLLLANLRYLGYTSQVIIINHIYDLLLLSSVIYFGFITSNVTCFSKSIENCALTKSEVYQVQQKIQSYLVSSEDYLQKDFSILNLYNAIEISPHKISLVISVVENKSFNAYINSFRIEKTKYYLKNNNYKKYTIEAIGYEVGFKTKSVFYSTFKKQMGITPAQYKKQLSA